MARGTLEATGKMREPYAHARVRAPPTPPRGEAAPAEVPMPHDPTAPDRSAAAPLVDQLEVRHH